MGTGMQHRQVIDCPPELRAEPLAPQNIRRRRRSAQKAENIIATTTTEKAINADRYGVGRHGHINDLLQYTRARSGRQVL
jgi:hypothetical protein